MWFVPVKGAEQQSVLMLHLGAQPSGPATQMLVNPLCAHMAEFGIIAPQGLGHVEIPTKTIAHQKRAAPGGRALDPADDRGPAEWHDR
jgi:transposase